MGDRPKKRRLRVAEEKSTQLAKGFRKAMTHAEVQLWQALRRKAGDGLRFRRQHPVGPYVADYACVPVKLVVEVDGATHSSDEELEHDRLRRNYMADGASCVSGIPMCMKIWWA